MSNLFMNIEAEQAVIGIFLTDDSYSNFAMQFMPSDFYVADHQKIIETIQAMVIEKKNINLVTFDGELAKRYDESTHKLLANKALEITTTNDFMSKYHFNEYHELIRSTAMRRNMLAAIEAAKLSLTTTNEETSVILDKTRQALRDIIITNHTWKSMPDVMMSTFEALEKRASGEERALPTGIEGLDTALSGFHKGELTIIGARPAVGKSAMGAHIALSAAANGYKVGICSREMTDVQYGTRIISRDADVDNKHLRTGQIAQEEWASVADAVRRVSTLPVNFVFSARHIEDLRMEVQKKVDANELDILVVDYLQLMQSRRVFEKDWLRIGYVSKMLKDMTVDFNISVIALAQVGRSVENTMPNLNDLRGSGDIEQDADNVIFMHRPKDASDRYVDPMYRNAFEQLKKNGRQYIVLNVAKQRQGEIGTISVVFDPARMRYTPIETFERGESA